MIRNALRIIGFAVFVSVGLGASTVIGRAAEPVANDPWPDLARQIFKERPLIDGAGLIALALPYRAEDAAVVPLTVRSIMPASDPRRMTALTIVIDQNPSPVAARFTFGPNAAVSTISTRVRVDSYTNVHAVAEMSDGKLYMVKTFVKAAGGCSAPAIKDASQAKIHLGEMRFRQFSSSSSAPVTTRKEAQIMIRHPNNSGLQMDQITHLYIPPFLIDDLKIWQGNQLVLAMAGGISISENPSIRFTFVPNGTAPIRAEAVDTEKHVFKGEWPATSSGM